jgi:hypothetical protein
MVMRITIMIDHGHGPEQELGVPSDHGISEAIGRACFPS